LVKTNITLKYKGKSTEVNHSNTIGSNSIIQNMKLIKSKKQLKNPLVWLEINSKKIKQNMQSIRSLVGNVKIMAVLKANAYGVGADQAAVFLEQCVDLFGVVGAREGQKLRAAGIKKTIVNLGIYNPDDANTLINNNIIPTLFNDNDLKDYRAIAGKKGVILDTWIKVDTGLGRLGIPYQNALAFIQRYSKSKWIKISGIYSTLTEDASFDQKQLNLFKNLKKQCTASKITIPVWSIASSATTFISKKFYFDMARIGLPIFGFYPSQEAKKTRMIKLKPAVTYKTRVACIKELKKGESIFYRRTFIAKQKTRVVVLLPGYSYGLDPRLVNGGNVLIGGKKYPLIGGISATNCFANIGMNKNIDVGDEVVVFGKQKKSEIKLENICNLLGKSPYEILSRIPEKITRLYN